LINVFKFYPENRAKFHFGDYKGKQKEIISSDQLFSALYNCAVMLYGSSDENPGTKLLLNLTFSSLYFGLQFFNISSGEKKELFFLPRPLAPIYANTDNKDLVNLKKSKKIKYLSLEAYRLLCKSWQSTERYFNFDLLELESIGGNFACTKDELQSIGLERECLNNIKVFNLNTKPRVVVSRSNDTSENLYYQNETEVTYQKERDYLIRPFMYFITKDGSNSKLRAMVRLMADEGVGGKRSQGMGILGKVEEENWHDDIFNWNGQFCIALSSVFPTLNEIDRLVYYELEERRGYIYSQYGRAIRKKRVRLLKEGSVFSDVVNGQIIEVGPDEFKEHDVYLNGRAFLIPIGEV